MMQRGRTCNGKRGKAGKEHKAFHDFEFEAIVIMYNFKKIFWVLEGLETR